MARVTRKPGPPTVVFGVYGQGEAALEMMSEALDDYIEGLGEVTPKFVIPLGKVETTDTIVDLVSWIDTSGYTYEVLHAEAYGRNKALKEIAEGATKVTKVEDIGAGLAERLGAATESRLLFLWAEDADGNPDDDDQRVLFQVADEEVVALDLGGGLEEIPIEGGSESAEDTEPAADEEAVADEDEASDLPPFEEVDAWPVRKIRAFALDEELHGEDALTSEETDAMSKDEILAYFYPDEFPEDAAEEPAPAPQKAARATPSTESAGPLKGKARATQVREDAEEATGEEVTRPAARKTAAAAKKAAATEESGETRVRGQRAKDAKEAEKVFDRLSAGNDEAQSISVEGQPLLSMDEVIEKYGDLLADIIIDRIADRVKAEPADSPIRQEIAPRRPPGKPRADGKAPVRSARR